MPNSNFQQRAGAARRTQKPRLHCCWLAVALTCAGPCAAQQAEAMRADLPQMDAKQVVALPETPVFRYQHVADGLPGTQVYALDEDQDGYLWIGTNDGLARFDGIAFDVYRFQPGAPDSLPGNNAQAVHVDAANRVWVGVEGGGLARIDADRHQVRVYAKGSPAALGSNEVWAITSTPDGAVWFGTFDAGLYRLNPDSDELTGFHADPDSSGALMADTVLDLALDASGQLLVAGVGGVQRRVGDHFEMVADVDSGLPGPVVLKLHQAGDGRLWIATNRGLRYLDDDGQLQVPDWIDGLSGQAITAFLDDPSGGTWLGTQRGLDRLRDDQLQAAASSPWRSEALAQTSIMDILRDHEGGLWFATLDAGLARLPPSWRNFSVFAHYANDSLSPSAPYVRGVAPALDGGLWLVGRRSGLDWIDPQNGTVTHRRTVEQLADDRLWSVLQTAPDAVWIGHHRGLTRINPGQSGEQRTDWSPESANDATPLGPIDLLHSDGHGGVWIAANGSGIQHRDAQGRVLATLTVDGGQLQDGEIEGFATAADERLWLANGQGLLRIDDDDSVQTIDGIASGRVYAFCFDGGDSIWLQRLDRVQRYQREGSQWRLAWELLSRDGAPAVAAGGIAIDSQRRVWLTTARGLWRIDPRDSSVRHFGVRDGLPSVEFSNRPFAQMRDGRIAVGTAGGLVLFDPDRVAPSSAAPRLELRSVSVLRGGRMRYLDPLQDIHLQHGDQELSIHARLRSFADPRGHRFRFRLEGVDADWVDVGASGERNYPSLPVGSFRLGVLGANADGVWSARPLQRQVAIDPAWWDSRWARIAALGLLMVLLALAARLYRQRLAARHAAQLVAREREWAMAASDAKSRFLATMGHEIRTPMTGVLGMSELLLDGELGAQQRHRVQAIQRSGRHMLRLLNDALDLSRIEAGKLGLQIESFSVNEVLQDVDSWLRPQADAKGLQWHCTLADDVPTALVGDAHRLCQILLNLGSNAVKFTERGFVRLQAGALEPQGIWFEVSDSGPGLDVGHCSRLFQRFEQADGARTAARYGGSGLGLAISQELAALMEGTISVSSAVGVGTSFRLELPLPPSRDEPVARNIERRTPSGPGDGSAAKGLRILLVEDDATVADVVGGLLHSLGHSVEIAAHGLDALTRIAGKSTDNAMFDLAFIDLDLPGIDGFELARLLRDQGRTISMIALTARTDTAAEVDAAAAGMNGFIRKPVSADCLKQAISALKRTSPES